MRRANVKPVAGIMAGVIMIVAAIIEIGHPLMMSRVSPGLPVITPASTGFPDASNTGYPAGTSFTNFPSGITVTTDNTVIDAADTWQIVVHASNVIIKNSYIHGSGLGIYLDQPGDSVTVQDTTVDCEMGTSASGSYGIRNDDGSMDIERVEVTDCENGVYTAGNTTVRDSYIHDLATGDGSLHQDGIQSSGPAGNVTIDHNTVLARDTSAIIMCQVTCLGGAKSTNWTITDNYLQNPDSATIRCAREAAGVSGIVVTGNHLKHSASFPGYTDSCDLAGGTVNTWTGNVDADTGATVNADDGVG